MSKTHSTPLTIRIDPQLKADLQELARSDDRSLANFVERLLRREVGKKRPSK